MTERYVLWYKSLRRNLTPTNSSSNSSSRDDMKLPTSLTSTEKIFKKSQEIIDERMAVSRGSKQSSRSIDGEGSIVLDVDHGLYSPPQLSNNIQSVFIVQSPWWFNEYRSKMRTVLYTIFEKRSEGGREEDRLALHLQKVCIHTIKL